MIQHCSFEKNLFDSIHMRTVRISRFIAESVMLAMYGYPLFGDHAGCEPQPESKEMCHCRMKLYASVCLASVQEKCDSNNGNVRCNQCV